MGYDTIKLGKRMVQRCWKKFYAGSWRVWTFLANYIGSELEGLDAYQRQLKRYGIKVSGAESDSVEKFFNTADSSALFPEYISRAVAQGINEANSLNEIIATKTMINGMDYRSITIPKDDETQSLKRVAKDAEFRLQTIKKQEKLVSLTKQRSVLEAFL